MIFTTRNFVKSALFFAISSFLAYKILLPRRTTLTPDQLYETYDFIIVGAGTAGCVLAARLSAQPHNFTVLLLEAGPEETSLIYSHIPKMAALIAGSILDWKFESQKAKHCCQDLKNGGKHKYPQGKVLGGSGIMNMMFYVRGHPEDFDHWSRLGNDLWSYDQMLPFFKMSETIEVDRLRNSDLHGRDGPLHVTQIEPTRLANLTFEAAQSLGYDFLDEMTGSQSQGLGLSLFVSHSGQRQSTVRTYLRPAMAASPGRLHVVTDAWVSRVLLRSDDGLRAVGVEFDYEGRRFQVRARKEVVLSAGALSTPKLMMLSGLGPEGHLRDRGVQVRADLPAVGSHLQDHIQTCVIYKLNQSLLAEDPEYKEYKKLWILAKATWEYGTRGRGMLAQPAIDSMGFFKSGLSNNTRWNDLQLYILADAKIYPIMELMEKFYGYSMPDPGAVPQMVILNAVQLHPQSRGTVRLADSDPRTPPLIDPNFGHAEVDIKVQARGMRLLLDLIQSRPLRPFSPEPVEQPAPACGHLAFLSDAYLECAVRSRMTTNIHPAGTCRMGAAPTDSVVDQRLRVHGVRGLRIADASVFPAQVSGNPNAAVVAVAERAARFILAPDSRPSRDFRTRI